MPRYFFHVRDGEEAFDDETGKVYLTCEAAKATAAQIARELAADDATYQGYHVCVIDEDGNKVARLPVRL